jgi:hypothetical protein
MENLARKFQGNMPVQDLGVINRIGNGTFTVETRSGTYEARQALSCLISPRMNDKVLLMGEFPGDLYILAVLERDAEQKQTLSFQGDVDFTVKNGRLKITSEQGMSFSSARDIDLASPVLNVNSLQSEVHLHRLVFSGNFWLGKVEKIRLIVSALDTFIERLTQRIKRSYRTVEEIDHLKAGRLDYLVDKLLSLRGKYAMFTAKEDVKIDAERIHMG